MVADLDSKAVQAVAVATGKAIDAGRDLGGFAAKVLGTLPEDAVGLLGGDWVSHVRQRNAHRLQLRTDEILATRNAEIEPVSLSVARPLLEAAQDESRDELVELWARLLANAMDKKRPQIRKSFIEALKRFDPLDALVMEKSVSAGGAWVRTDHWERELNVTEDELAISLKHLTDIGCLEEPKGVMVGNKMVEGLLVSPFGRELMRACSP